MNKPCSKWPTNALLVAGLCLLVFATRPAQAGDSAPDWLRQLAHAPLGTYPDEADGVVLLDEQTLTVKDNGDMFITYRRAVKILRPGGKSLGLVMARCDKDTKLESIRAWSITASGQEYELKDKDAVETSLYDEALYIDIRLKAIKLPAVDVGSVVAFEYQQRRRPQQFTDRWSFQEQLPVKSARFNINLPAGWEYQYNFGNWPEKKPTNIGGNSWRWEMNDIDGIVEEPDMPAAESLAGAMVVAFYSASQPQSSRMSTWDGVADWTNSLNVGRRVASPKMQQKIAELTAGKQETVSKIHAVASYAQHNVRYVEISIGIGGVQAHMAADTFANSYGDCKDKATLLITMLHEVGVEAYLALVDSERGVVNPSFPAWSFNHAIVAIRLPASVDASNLYATVDDPKLGKILFFDPTSEMTAFGMLPAQEQNSYSLVVTGNGGELIKMPLLAPPLNRLLRVAHLQLTPEGHLLGEVHEIRSGYEASVMRARLLGADRDKRVKVIESFLGEFLDRSRLTYASIGGLDKYDEPLILNYKFEAANYAKSAGDLMLVRPRVLGNKASGVAEDKKRKYPVAYETTSLQSDDIEIKLPAGYQVDELPASAKVSAPFAEYVSTVEAKDNVLHYNRSYTVKDLLVPMDEMSTLRTFMRGVAADERNTAVLKKTP